MRVWTVGDPEPADHPMVSAGAVDQDMGWAAVYAWECPTGANGFTGGWWLLDGDGDLWDWEEILNENTVLTEYIEEGP